MTDDNHDNNGDDDDDDDNDDVAMYNNKQLLDEVEHDSENYQGRGLCYLPKPKAEADNTNQGLDNFAIMRKPNPIIVLLYNYKCTSVETFHRTTTK